MTSRYLKPRTYYLLALGLAAIAFEAGRRLIPQIRKEGEPVIIEAQPQPAAPASRAKAYENGSPAAAPEKKVPVKKAKPATQAKSAPAAPASAEGNGEIPRAMDDLTQIKGIGPTYARRLRDAGLATYADIAAATPDQLREVTKAATMTDVSEWISSARALRQN
jgi:predicted flap endonuclease-1-like 5' DNA nuclease